MKRYAFPLAITVLTLVIVGLFVVFSRHQNTSQAFTSPQDDTLTSATIVADLNALRQQHGLSVLEDNPGLDGDASVVEQNTALASDTVAGTFSAKSVTPAGSHYSAQAILRYWLADPAKAAVLLRPGTEVGTSGTLVPNPAGGKMPFVVVIIR